MTQNQKKKVTKVRDLLAEALDILEGLNCERMKKEESEELNENTDNLEKVYYNLSELEY